MNTQINEITKEKEKMEPLNLTLHYGEITILKPESKRHLVKITEPVTINGGDVCFVTGHNGAGKVCLSFALG